MYSVISIGEAIEFLEDVTRHELIAYNEDVTRHQNIKMSFFSQLCTVNSSIQIFKNFLHLNAILLAPCLTTTRLSFDTVNNQSG